MTCRRLEAFFLEYIHTRTSSGPLFVFGYDRQRERFVRCLTKGINYLISVECLGLRESYHFCAKLLFFIFLNVVLRYVH